jgi:hypothetical protein
MGNGVKLIYHNCIICNKWGTSGFSKDQDTLVKHIKNHPWLVGDHNVEDCVSCSQTLEIQKIIVGKILENDNRVKQGLLQRECLFIIPLHDELIHFCIPSKGGYYF